MNKKLLIAAVGMALVAGPMMAAQAAPTVYGKLNVGFAHVDSGNSATTTTGGDTWAVTDDASRIGIMGDEDLGGGLKMIYQLENTIDVDNGGWGAARDHFVGMQGSSWGSIRLGQYNSAYKNVWTGIELFGDTHGDFTGSINTFAGGETRLPNNIGYTSPNMSGLTVQLESSRGETGTTVEPNPMNLAIKYSAGPLYVGFGWFDNDQQATTGFDGAKKLAASYKMDAITIVAALERQDNKGAYATYDTTHIGGMYTMGNNAFALTYTQYAYNANGTAITGSEGDYDATQLALGVFHTLSKNTVVKAVYTTIDNGKRASYAGRLFSSSSVGLTTPAIDKDPTSLQVSIQTSF
jgi:predicted porin